MEKNKKQISTIQKTQKQNKRVNKGKKKERKKGETNGLVHLHCFCIYFICSICFFCIYFVCFLLFARTKKIQTKSKQKANRESNINAKKKQMDKSIFPQRFFTFLTLLCSTIYVASCFFRFLIVAFWFSICFPLFAFFSSLKLIRISNWERNTNICIGQIKFDAVTISGQVPIFFKS